MEQPTHIFPIIECIRKGNTLILQTTLRKKHEGKYYYWNFEAHKYVPEGKDDWGSAISAFNRDLYLAQLHGTIDPELTLKDGTPYYTLCENQVEEIDRMDPKNRLGGYVKEETIKTNK